MKKKQKSILVLAIISVFMATVLFLPSPTDAGDNKHDQMMTMLDEIYDIVLDTNSKVEGVLIQKTGQTTSYATGDDGNLEKGEEWPDPRFTNNIDGTVTDNLTGLIWLKNANCFGELTWAGALSACNTLASPACGLTDGSVAGDWRLANVREIFSLIDFSQFDPALPVGHPFTNVQSDYYWSSTTKDVAGNAWNVRMYHGQVGGHYKAFVDYVWPVRGGN